MYVPYEKFSARACVGCGACALVCPTKAIEMRESDEGFLYPHLSESLCIGCRRCENVCQLEKAEGLKNRRTAGQAYCAVSKNEKIWGRAASGGVAGTIASYVLSEAGSFVCGCVMDDNQTAVHRVITDAKELPLLAGSKYVQSNLGLVYKEIREKLLRGERGVFFGTPCQVAGLKQYLYGVDAKQLTTVDVICHGVPSPKFLRKALEHYRGEREITTVSFRKKSGFFKKSGRFNLCIDFRDGGRIVRPSKCDAYYDLFMRGETFRESCYVCPFASPDRCSDITIGDCDTSYLYRHVKGERGKSAVIIHTEHGRDLWDGIRGDFWFNELDLAAEMRENHQLEYPSKRPPERDWRYRELYERTYEELNAKYAAKYGARQRLAGFLDAVLPSAVYRAITGALMRK